VWAGEWGLLVVLSWMLSATPIEEVYMHGLISPRWQWLAGCDQFPADTTEPDWLRGSYMAEAAEGEYTPGATCGAMVC